MRDYMRDDYGSRFPENDRQRDERLEYLISGIYTDLLNYIDAPNKELMDKVLLNVAEASHLAEMLNKGG